METTLEWIAELEWANYAAMLPTTQVSPDIEVVLRDDVVLSCSPTFPLPDLNHACLLRATSETADGLIDEITGYYQSKGVQPYIMISPACTPADWPERLLARGFVKQDGEDAWLVLELPGFVTPPRIPNVDIRQLGKDQSLAFAKIYLAAFGMPEDFAPYMAQLLEPSMKQPEVYPYIALIGEQAIGVCSLLCHEKYSILGSMGVLPEQRKSGAAINMAIKAIHESQRHGLQAMMLQTAGGAWLERYLLASGFKKVFSRYSYALP